MLHSELTRVHIDKFGTESGKIRLSGWIAHPSVAITEIRIALNGDYLCTFGPLIDRMDVIAKLQDYACTAKSGFDISVPFKQNFEDMTAVRIEIVPESGVHTLTPVQTRYFDSAEEDAPKPPFHLQERIGGASNFRTIGYQAGSYLRTYFEKYSGNGRRFGKVLDWGCGCGRLVWEFCRFLPANDIYGCDIDSEAIRWDKENIAGPHFRRVEPYPPTPYPDDFFDTIYAISVMTHLDEEAQFLWLSEMQRIARPGAVLIFSVSGTEMESNMPPYLLDAFKKKGFAEYVPSYAHLLAEYSSPEYYKETYHDRNYIEKEWSRYFTMLEYVETRYQDLVVMRAGRRTKAHTNSRSDSRAPSMSSWRRLRRWTSRTLSNAFSFRMTDRPSLTENRNDLIDPENDRVFLNHRVSGRVHGHPAMLGTEERQLPAFISASLAERPGAIVELGCYLGGSTVAILDGLDHCEKLEPEPRKMIHSYDLFLANDFMLEHSLAPFGISSGESFRPAFNELLGDWSPFVEVHEGNILEETWPDERIKLLYVDILWSWETNQHVFDQFYRRLEKGSWLIHQDYVYSAYPWLPISMEWLVEKEYFAFRSYAQYSTVAFECLKSPDEVEQSFRFSENLSLSEKRRLLQKAASRFAGYPQGLLRLADCVLMAHLGKTEEARTCVRDVARSYSHILVAEHVKMVRSGLSLE